MRAVHSASAMAYRAALSRIVPRRLDELLNDSDPGRARRAMEAMLKMGKIQVAELEHAADAA